MLASLMAACALLKSEVSQTLTTSWRLWVVLLFELRCADLTVTNWMSEGNGVHLYTCELHPYEDKEQNCLEQMRCTIRYARRFELLYAKFGDNTKTRPSKKTSKCFISGFRQKLR